MKNINPFLLADFYKESHADLYDEDTERVYATWTPRTSRIAGVNNVVVFGLQYFIQRYLIDYFNENFFNKDADTVIDEYIRVMEATLGNEGIGRQRLHELHELGYLPIRIDAMEEGSLCPIKVPCMTIENTHKSFFWVTNFLETLLSTEIWKPMTSATIALQYKQLLDEWADKTCDNRDHVEFQGYDFSMRGMAGVDACMTSSAGHLLSFSGTDTIPALFMLEEFYKEDLTNKRFKAIPATEHSIMEVNSAFENNNDALKELNAFKRIITEVHPKGFVSIVSDTWNLWEVCSTLLPALKDEVMNRDGRVVIRPDSGNPVDIVCGTTSYEEGVVIKDLTHKNSPYDEQIGKGVIELLWDTFGGTINSKGYKVLDSHIGAIYGDAITVDRARQICERLEAKGFASSNIVFGIGSYTYQMNTRDTFGFALKSTFAVKDGHEVFIFKDPITDDGTKKSQKGKVAVIETPTGIKLVDHLYDADYNSMQDVNLLKPLFYNGSLVRETSLQQVRDKLQASLLAQSSKIEALK